MPRRKNSRRNAAQRPGAVATPIAAHGAPSVASALPTHATMFFSSIPVVVPGAPVAAWLRISTRDALRVAACECGARLEERVRAKKTLRGGDDLRRFVGQVLANTGAVTSFASMHLSCAVAALHGPTMCRETFWGVPSAVPATVRFWADEVLERTLEDRTADDRVTVSIAVLTIDPFGREQSYWREVPPHPTPSQMDVDLWIRASLLTLAAECPGRLVGAMLVAREPNVGGAGGDPPAIAFIATPQTRFSGLLAFEARRTLGRSAEPRRYDWQPMILPNDVFDGLFA